MSIQSLVNATEIYDLKMRYEEGGKIQVFMFESCEVRLPTEMKEPFVAEALRKAREIK